MAWFKKSRKPIESSPAKASKIPEGLWVKCPGCSQAIFNKDLATNLHVCPKCGHHFRIGAAERLKQLLDGGRFVEHDAGLTSTDPLAFVDTKPYTERLRAGAHATGLKDAVISATGTIDGQECVVRRWSTPSSAAAWAWWWARRSRAPSSARSNGVIPSSSSRAPAARG